MTAWLWLVPLVVTAWVLAGAVVALLLGAVIGLADRHARAARTGLGARTNAYTHPLQPGAPTEASTPCTE